MNVVAPNVKNLTRGGAIVYFQRGGDAGYIDLGNIPDFGFSTPTQFVEHKTSRSGKIIMDRREPTEFSNSFKISVDEYNVENMRFLYNAAAAAAFAQSSATATVVHIADPVLGHTYDLGAFAVTSVVVKVSTTTMVEGTDYTLEADLGMITILPGGSILSSDTVDVTFNQPGIAGDILSPLSNAAAISGAIKIYYRTSDNRLMVWVHTTAQISFSGDTSFSGSDFAKTQAEILIMPDYVTNPDAPFGTQTIIPPPSDWPS